MKRNELKTIVCKKIKCIQAHGKFILLNGDKEAVHAVRVDFKKIRALLRLYRSTHKKNRNLPLPAVLKQLYHAAGALRDRQVYLELLLAYHADKQDKPVNYLKQISGDIKFHQEKLEKLLKIFPFDRVRKNMADLFYSKLRNKQVKQYFLHAKKQLKQLRRHAQSDTSIHTIRKNIKDLLYNASLFKKNKKAGAVLKKRKWLKEIEDRTGTLNNIRVALSFIKRNRQQTPADRIRLQSIMQSWAHKKNILKRVTLSQLKAF
jgi:tRNA nucleotidyltransferase/poly(A) polymerase